MKKALALLKKIKDKFLSKKDRALSLLSLAGFILILSITWIYFSKHQNELGKNEEKHVWLQNEFQNLLSDLIEKKQPEISEIIFHRIWTKNTKNPKEVKIFFNYSLITRGEAGGRSDLEGSALLKETEKQFWTIYDFTINKSVIDFSEPLVISAEPDFKKTLRDESNRGSLKETDL